MEIVMSTETWSLFLAHPLRSLEHKGNAPQKKYDSPKLLLCLVQSECWRNHCASVRWLHFCHWMLGIHRYSNTSIHRPVWDPTIFQTPIASAVLHENYYFDVLEYLDHQKWRNFQEYQSNSSTFQSKPNKRACTGHASCKRGNPFTTSNIDLGSVWEHSTL